MSTQTIQNLNTFDPFADADDAGEGRQDTSGKRSKQESKYIHIRIQQRNGRKTLTTIQGVPEKFALKVVLKHMKKTFSCNGTIVEDEDLGEVIQLQGDQRKDAFEFLTDKKDGLGLPQNIVKVHGF